VARDNTVCHDGRRLQLPASPVRAHYVKATVKVRESPDGTLAVFHGPRRIGRYDAQGAELINVPTAGSLTPYSPPSRRGLAAGEPAARASRRPALTAAACGVSPPARVGTWRNRGVTTAGTGWTPRNGKERDHVPEQAVCWPKETVLRSKQRNRAAGRGYTLQHYARPEPSDLCRGVHRFQTGSAISTARRTNDVLPKPSAVRTAAAPTTACREQELENPLASRCAFHDYAGAK
jgi:hypothetical protein